MSIYFNGIYKKFIIELHIYIVHFRHILKLHIKIIITSYIHNIHKYHNNNKITLKIINLYNLFIIQIIFLYIPKQLYFVKSKVIFLFLYLGLCPIPHFFCDRRECLWYCHKEARSLTGSDTLRERLHLGFNLINYLTCKTILV